MKKNFQIATLVSLTLVTFACNNSESTTKQPKANTETLQKIASPGDKLDYVLDTQPDKNKLRYNARNPKETIEFFGVKPGMTVVEVYPGWKGWYTQILLPYLGSDGLLIGADYAADMFPKFGIFDDGFIEYKKVWVEKWPPRIKELGIKGSASIKAFQFGSMPESINETADVLLFIRSLHNLARFESDGNYLSVALEESYRSLKPGGILGIVQHMAPEEASDEWANGKNGYLKKSFVIARLEQAGFEYIDSSDINVNVKDQPTEQDYVWRLPPTLKGSKDNEELRQKNLAIGESSRMTLKFRKPVKQ